MRSLDFYAVLKRLMSTIMSICVKIKSFIPFVYFVFQINQGEKSSTHLLTDDKIYQWSKVSNFLEPLYSGIFTQQIFTHPKCMIP